MAQIAQTCLPSCENTSAENLPVTAPPTGTVAPFDVERETCDGLVTDQVTQEVSVSIKPGTVVYVKKCAEEAEFDHSVLCDPSGAKVIVIVTYAATGIPTTAFYTLAGDAYTGDLSLLTACDIDLESDPIDFCDSGVSVIQWVVKKDGQPTGVVYWTDALTGSVIGTPAAPVRGLCQLGGKLLIYMERNGGVVTIADIVAATSGRVLSVTVKQISGQGTIKADAGSGVPFDAGEVWGWSAISEQHTEDFTASGLTMDSGTGEQRITATYIA